MGIKTLNLETLGDKESNKYEKIVVLSKRARQIAAQEKMELDDKLKYFEGFEDEDEFTFNEEQERISKAFEQLPHATQRSVQEMLDDKITYRYPKKD
ncbi:DNA-directed RNA polymerase subunit omega [Rhodohalobacter mucosus]|uniref:DNA-directed RNA polymerase subunit omega n=1 Tax=Rhodohalobacter mucosus TaxID=2079485 RepID=A0A316TSD9_9BACT|nr:DNA-directed RNA polymerase subunit omega [Rhodohalobacter mucosus]PWN06551.1 DNA-directed RNA polymerase subunit omega [Rhodohalobacter mucosus]